MDMKKNIFTGLFMILTLITCGQTPSFQWAKSMGGYYGIARGASVTSDISGNIYTTGSFEGRVDFDPGAGTTYLTALGGNDIFTIKQDGSGNLIWAKRIGGISDDKGTSIIVTPSGILVAGYFTGTVDFDPGAPVTNLTSAGGTDAYISLFDAGGNFIYVRQFGGSMGELIRSLALNSTNEIFATGGFSGIVDFDPGTGTYNMNAGGTDNTFILKLSSSGNFVWAKQLGSSIIRGNSISVDLTGNVYTAGEFTNTVDFDPGAAIFNLTPVGPMDGFVIKLNSAGNFVWAKTIGSSGFIYGKSVKADASGNVYLLGDFYGVADFDPGPNVYNLTPYGNLDGYLTKLDASGNHVWTIQIGGTSSDEVNSLHLDGSGNFYITGLFNGTVDFDHSSSTFNLTTLSWEIFVLKLNASGTFAWVKQAGGSSNDAGLSITVDASGNVYHMGYFSKFSDFDPGTSVFNLTAIGGNFMYLSKLNSSGNFLWANAFGSGSATFVKSMTTDASGNVYTTGYFYGNVDFDPSPAVFTLSTLASDIDGDVFVTKCNSSGNLLWAKQFGSTSHDYANSIAVDASGNVFTSGSFKGTVDFDPGLGTFNLITTSTEIFISKLDASGNFGWATKMGTLTNIYSLALDASGNIFCVGNYFSGTHSNQIYINKVSASGNLLWSKNYGGTGSEQANAVVVDQSGNMYITGSFTGTTDFDPGTGIYNVTSAGFGDAFISKLDGSGNLIWIKQLGGTDGDQGIAMTIDAAGMVYITGTFFQTADFDPGPGTFNMTAVGFSDIFICKLDNTGNLIWAKQFAGNNSDLVRAIGVDNTGSVYTAGTFYTTTDFDPGSGINNLTSNGQDGFVSKLNSSGNFVWAQQIGNAYPDQVYSMAVDLSSNVYTTGNYYQTVDFDPGTGISNLTAIGNPDMFIFKLSQCITPTASITASGPTSFCLPGSVTLNANTGIGLSYQWIKNGVFISGATSSGYIATTTGSYTVTVINNCGTSISSPVSVTASSSIPSAPGSITTSGGVVKVCPGEQRTYSVTSASGISSYTWIPCIGSIIISGQNTNSVIIQYNSNFPASDTLRVVANNTCGTSTQRKLKVSRNNPAAPSAITGDNYAVCNLSGKPYSVTNVTGMSYSWSFNNGMSSVASGQGTSSITANYSSGFISGSLSVTANNACGTSIARLKTIYAKPATPAAITGTTSVCANQQDVPYSITPLSNVINYTWTGPTGSHISDGTTTSSGATLVTTSSSVTVDFATTAGSVKVRGNNACASGSYKSLAVTMPCREKANLSVLGKLNVYPNPVTDYLFVDNASGSEIKILDAAGKIIIIQKLTNHSTVQTNGLVPGIYFYEIIYENKMQSVGKFMKN
jgi:hypothetical protein